MNFKLLKAGTTIYRARSQDDHSEYTNPNLDSDTGKFGLYFSDAVELCEAMSIEYNKDLYIFEFKITKTLKLFNGKYSFRNINKNRYFDSNNQFIPNVDIVDNENINHYDLDGLPIIDNVDTYFENIDMEFGEIFINNDDLQYVQYIGKKN